MSAAGSDYISTTMDVTFDPGATTASVTVQIIDDTYIEENEIFSAFLTSSESNVVIGDDMANVTIVDDDGESHYHPSSHCYFLFFRVS